MTLQKYPVKFQIITGLIFGVMNFLFSALSNEVLHLPLFMDMVFIFAGSFFGILCGLITAVIHYILNFFMFYTIPLNMLYSICSFTGIFFTWLFITRKKEFSWIQLAILFFTSAIVISFEGSLIHCFLISRSKSYNESEIIMFLSYNLVLQELGLQLSFFLARLPVNLFDKAIAVFGGFGIYLIVGRSYTIKTE